MKVYEVVTPLAPTEVLDGARTFFMLAGSPYAAFPEQRGDGFVKLHLEVGEIVIAALPHEGGTLVRGSASRGAQLLTRYLTLLGSLKPAGVAEKYSEARRVA